MDESLNSRLTAYLALRQQRPAAFVNQPGGIEIALDPDRIAAIEQHVA